MIGSPSGQKKRADLKNRPFSNSINSWTLRTRLGAERLAATAGRFGVRIFNREPRSLQIIDIVDFRSLEHRRAVGIDKELHTVHFEHAVLIGGFLFKGHSILVAGTAPSGDIN